MRCDLTGTANAWFETACHCQPRPGRATAEEGDPHEEPRGLCRGDGARQAAERAGAELRLQSQQL